MTSARKGPAPAAGRGRTAPWDALLAGVTGAAAFAVYVRSLAPGLLWGDSAEFQFAAWLGGFVHPTGYPLYLLLGWLWSHLFPLGDPAFGVNLFSAVWGGVAVGLLSLVVMRSVRLLGDRSDLLPRVTGVGTGLVFTFTPTFWSQAVIAEVYTMHAAIAGAVLLALLTWAQRTWAGEDAAARRSWYAAALLLGLGLAHHRSTLLLLPAAATWVALVRRTRGGGAGQPASTGRLVPTLVALLAPLALYLLIPLRAPRVAYAQLALSGSQVLPLYDATLRGFIAHITGSVFSSSLAAPRDAAALADLGTRFIGEVSVNGLIVGGIGLLWLIVASVRRERAAAALLALTGLAFLAQVVFNLFYAIGDIAVFYIPAYLVWMIWLGVGAWTLARGVRWALPGRAGALAVAVAAAALLLALVGRSAVIQWPRVQRAGDTSASDAWEAILAAQLPADAVLVSNDRDEMVPLWYLKHVEGRAAGIDGLFPLIQPGEEWSDVVGVTGQALASGRPVYLVKPMAGLETKFEIGESLGGRAGGLGPLVAVAPLPQAAPRQANGAVFGDTLRLLGYETERDAGDIVVTLWWEVLKQTAADWTTFVQLLEEGDAKAGQSDHRPGGEYYPTSRWRPGEIVRDVHRIPAGGQGVAGQTYRLLAGLYRESAGNLERLGEPQVVGEVAP